MENKKPRSRKKKKLGWKFGLGISLGVAAALAVIGGVIYIQEGKQYETVFFPNTTMNGMDVSGKTAGEVKQLISAGIDGYELKLSARGAKTETIKGSDIGLESVFDGSLEKLLEAQNPNEWWKHRKTAQEFEISTMIAYQDEKFQELVKGLSIFHADSMTEPQNAAMSDYVSGQGYSVVPAEEGTKLQEDVVMKALREAVMELKEELDLEELGAYERPQVNTDDPALIRRVQSYNKLAGVTVTYQFGNKQEVLNGDTISGWLGEREDGTVYVSSTSVAEYVKKLADEYDTYNKAKVLKTGYGQTVKISRGSYGWRINQDTEAGELAAVIQSGESQTREPVYRQKAAGHGDTDYGNTYVELNLTAQHLFFYKDGKLVVESDFVSGNESKGWATPAGVYPLTYKERNATLKGENYRTPVDYWMPFNGGIGLHDAKWRSSFGGTLYKNGGSHGCVNLPPTVAAKIFDNISAGTPVLAYHLDGTESGNTSTGSGKPQETTTAAQPTTASPTTEPLTEPASPTTAQTTEPASPTTASAAPTEAPVTTAPTKAPSTNPGGNGGNGPGVPSGQPASKEVGPGVS